MRKTDSVKASLSNILLAEIETLKVEMEVIRVNIHLNLFNNILILDYHSILRSC